MTKKRKIPSTSIQGGSGNVYADLGYPDPERMLVKAELAAAIAQIIADRGLSQGAAADIVGLAQPKLSNLLRGQFRGLSERRLMDCLTHLGRDIQIVVKAAPRSRGWGKLSVVVR